VARIADCSIYGWRQWLHAPRSDLVHRIRLCLVQLCALTGPVLLEPAVLARYTRWLATTVVTMAGQYGKGS
jgi:hypothetical protein